MCGLPERVRERTDCTENHTLASYTPVREIAGAQKQSAATYIIYGLTLGYVSCIIPVLGLGSRGQRQPASRHSSLLCRAAPPAASEASLRGCLRLVPS